MPPVIQDDYVVDVEEEEEELVGEEAVHARDWLQAQIFKCGDEIPIPEKGGLFESVQSAKE
jgi:hypothetical protein